MVPLKYLSNFWRTLEIALINCDINVILTWSANGFIIDNLVDNQVPKFALTDKKFYVPVMTLSAQDNGNPYFKEYYRIIAKDLNKQQALDVDSKAIHQVNSRKSRLI